jgi:Lon protease-like protein
VIGSDDRAVIRRLRAKLEALLAPTVAKAGADVINASAMSDEDLINALAQYLDLEPLEKQALLERHCLRSRAESLVELLEMKIMMSRTPGMSTVAH